MSSRASDGSKMLVRFFRQWNATGNQHPIAICSKSSGLGGIPESCCMGPGAVIKIGGFESPGIFLSIYLLTFSSDDIGLQSCFIDGSGCISRVHIGLPGSVCIYNFFFSVVPLQNESCLITDLGIRTISCEIPNGSCNQVFSGMKPLTYIISFKIPIRQIASCRPRPNGMSVDE